MNWLLGPYAEGRTYGVLAYLLLGLPLGIVEFTLVVTGLSLGFGLAITIVGIPLLVGVLFMTRGLATMEREMARSLLDAPMPRLAPGRDDAGGTFLARLRNLALGGRTWREAGFLLLRLPLGALDFTVAVTLISLALGAFGMIIAVAAGATFEFGTWKIDTIAEALIYLPVSVLFLLVGPRLMLAWSNVSRAAATALLGRVETGEMKAAVVDAIARRGEADGFQVLDDLGLKLGDGPFLTPTRVEATLLALQSSGYVSGRQVGARTVYTLDAGSRGLERS